MPANGQYTADGLNKMSKPGERIFTMEPDYVTTMRMREMTFPDERNEPKFNWNSMNVSSCVICFYNLLNFYIILTALLQDYFLLRKITGDIHCM